MMTTKRWALLAAMTATLGFGCDDDNEDTQNQQQPPTMVTPDGDGALPECVPGEAEGDGTDPDDDGSNNQDPSFVGGEDVAGDGQDPATASVVCGDDADGDADDGDDGDDGAANDLDPEYEENGP